MNLETLDTLEKVDPSQWDAMVPRDDPFLEHAFLVGLERSGSVGPPETGWIPRHIILRESGQLVGAMPLYEKSQSYGEFIFDWDWAAGAQRAGIPYYPKLVGAVPFTPVSGSRLLVAPGQAPEKVWVALADGARELAASLGAMSIHILFLPERERAALERCGWLGRSTHQYHWARSSTWKNFEDYLAAMKARHRKQVRRERREASAHNLDLCVKRGEDLGELEWAALWQFYLRTVAQKWSFPYLNHAFFNYLRDVIPHRVLVALAYRDKRPVAGALFLTRGDALFGRYWGATETLDFLHFELCYYLPMEWCLKHGIKRFETGAQGEHKIKRGFLPQLCSSVHWFQHQGMRDAVESYLCEERAHSDEIRVALERYSPFRERGYGQAEE